MADALPPELEDALADILLRQVDGREAAFARLVGDHPEHATTLQRTWRELVELEASAPAGPADVAGAPQRIGNYEIRAELGQGGMGTVYLAIQTAPVRRRVALKVIRRGLDSRQVLARFELERQALAVMNHDNIARIFDAGTTDAGQPFFVMEHVAGTPITTYCDRHRLGIADRLRLFQQVCAGVQHAHQKGVIHRDLKPGNVLVAEDQGRPVPKIIDFGVARATDQMAMQATIFTEEGQMVGTPEYMSPEQAEMSTADIDTRTDIYSLGVILYELLAGVLPFPSAELRRAGLLEIQRKIVEDEPPRPSARILANDVGTELHAERMRTSRTALLRGLRGDLDWIVMMAVDKDRNRRYATAQALADDIGRHLASEPVVAGPPGAGYRLRKFARRYRGRLVAAGLLLLTLLAGLGGTIAYAVAAERARQDEARERQKATVAARTANRIREFLEDILTRAEPGVEPDPDLKVRDVLERTAKRIETGLADEPAVQASLLFTVAQAYRGLELRQESRQAAEGALAIHRRDESVTGELGEPELGRLLLLLAEEHVRGGGTLEEADALLDEASRIFTAIEGEDSPHLVTVAGIRATNRLNRATSKNDQFDLVVRFLAASDPSRTEAETRRELLEIMRAVGEDWLAGRHAAARQRVRATIESGPMFKIPFMRKQAVIGVMRFGDWTRSWGMPEVAEPVFLENLAIAREVLEPTDASLDLCRQGLAFFLVNQKRYDEAAPYMLESFEFGQKHLPPYSRPALNALAGLLKIRLQQGRFADAQALVEHLPAPADCGTAQVHYVRRVCAAFAEAGHRPLAIDLAARYVDEPGATAARSTNHAVLCRWLGEWQLAEYADERGVANLLAAYDALQARSAEASARAAIAELLVAHYERAGDAAALARWQARR